MWAQAGLSSAGDEAEGKIWWAHVQHLADPSMNGRLTGSEDYLRAAAYVVAQFKSFVDPFIILLAVPPGVTGVLVMLTATGTTLNIMSLMGIVMMVGVVVSNSILIVEFTHRLIADGMPLYDAVRFAVRVRLRPVLMTSLATVIGLIPMALALGAGSESYAPLARSIIGGLIVSVALTVFIVPAAFFIWYRRKA